MAKAEKNEKMIKVTLVHGVCSCTDKQKKTVEALGLKKIRSSKIMKDTDVTRGMIAVVPHLVSVEDVK